MEKKNPYSILSLLLLFLMLSSIFLEAQSYGSKRHGRRRRRREGEALKAFFKAKFDKSLGIDTGPFKIVDDTIFRDMKQGVLEKNNDKNNDVFKPYKEEIILGVAEMEEGERSFEVKEEEKGSEKGMKEKDRIERLPGQPYGLEVSQYGGYVTVDKMAGRAFYYYFVEAQHSKESSPLLLWLNGGPGCSSLGFGAMQELGPFRVHSNGKSLYENIYSWNKVANVLFLESPAGVGFSCSNTSTDYKNGGDRKTAMDNYEFLVKWMERFPEYKGRDFYIAGESYAGHYVPQLAYTILHHNNNTAASNPTIINLKGIIIGNAVIQDATDFRGMYDFYASHALTSQEILKAIQRSCNFSQHTNMSKLCALATFKADDDSDGVNNFDIYGSMCFYKNTTRLPNPGSLEKFDPCSDYYVPAYLNRKKVQEAMHANLTQIKRRKWVACSDIIASWVDSPASIIPLLRTLMSHGLRVWIFSGDTDGRLPVTSTQYSIMSMKLPIKTPWYPWEVDREAGGYTQVYKGDLTFATVRGAGHQVPSYQPKRALTLISNFLNGTPLPKLPKSFI